MEGRQGGQLGAGGRVLPPFWIDPDLRISTVAAIQS